MTLKPGSQERFAAGLLGVSFISIRGSKYICKTSKISFGGVWQLLLVLFRFKNETFQFSFDLGGGLIIEAFVSS
jgi:hypothetical protein